MIFSRRVRIGALASTAGIALVSGFSAQAAEKKTIGLALTRWEVAMPGSEKDECPNGFVPTSIDNFNATYSDPKVRDAIGKSNEVFGAPEHRGPDAASVTFQPWIIKDPLPFPESQSKVAVGLNVDGTADGRETDTTCKHQKFSSMDGKASDIDNQLYRVSACWKGMRKGGHPLEMWNDGLIANPKNRFLIEISDVDDELNDDHVEVTFYKGVDKIVRDAAGAPYPWLSQRIDRRDPDYTQHTTGKIVNGELITDRMDKLVRPLIHSDFTLDEYETLDMTMRLKLGPTSAEGIMSGYYDVWKWYFFNAKNARVGVGNWSPSSLWKSLTANADGRKDPTTGQCSAISGAYAMQAVRAYIVKDDKLSPSKTDKPKTVATNQPETDAFSP